MSDTTHDTKRKWNPDGIFYGWWIVAGGSVVTAMGAGLNFYGFSAFFYPLSMEFGWSRSALSGVFALARLEGGFLGPVEGFLIDKYGPRKMMFIGIPLMGLGFILPSTWSTSSPSLWGAVWGRSLRLPLPWRTGS